MAGHVDEPDLAPGRQRRPREPQVDREPAALLLGQPVGVHAGQAKDQRGLPVIDVAGRRHHLRRAFLRRSSLFQRVADRPGQPFVVLRRHRPQVERDVAAARCGRTPAAGRGAGARRPPPARATGMRSPADGTAWPGSEPPPTAASLAPAAAPSKCAAIARARSRSAPPRLRQHPPERDVARAGPSRTGEASPRARPRSSCPGAPPGRPGCGGGARPRRRGPTTSPACGPPSSLSPENATRSAPGAQRLDHGRLVRRDAGVAVEQPAAHVVGERDARARGQRREVGDRRGVGEPDDAVVAGVHLQDQRGPRRDRAPVVGERGCGSSFRPRRAWRPRRP